MQRYPMRQNAVAYVRGGFDYPELHGKVTFVQRRDGVLVTAHIFNLPTHNDSGFFGFHIHEGTSCAGETFQKTGAHYNPTGAEHPRHAGDLPPLMRCGAGAYMAVMTDRFRLTDIIGRTVIIHSMPDDFTSPPSGNAGDKLACGVVVWA